MNEMDISISQVETNANETAKLSEQAQRDAEMGAEALSRTLAGIDKIKESSKEAASVIERGLRLDVHLGEGDAKALADSVRKNEHLQFTKIIAMSGKLTDGQAQTLRPAGYDGFLKKPFQVRQVVEAIEAATNLVR